MRWLYESVPGTPEGNMAADAALLSALAAAEGPAAVRVYFWDRPSVSIGRLQAEEPVRALFPGLPVVRRPTGGRAVRHGSDLTIAVAARLEHLPESSRSVMESHHLLTGAVLRALQACGIGAVFGGCAVRDQRQVVDCFALSAACDLIDGQTGQKLVGSAQRRDGAALLQQMSVPLAGVPDCGSFLAHLESEFQQTFSGDRFVDAPIN